MTPEELREKITIKESKGERYGVRTITGELLKSFTITYDDSFPLPPNIKEKIKDRIMADIYGDWQRRIFKAYQEVSMLVNPVGMERGYREAERNFLELLKIKVHRNEDRSSDT